jgi:hypothetical protein
MRSFRLDPDDIVLGSVLRRAMPSLVSERDLRYDTCSGRPARISMAARQRLRDDGVGVGSAG